MISMAQIQAEISSTILKLKQLIAYLNQIRSLMEVQIVSILILIIITKTHPVMTLQPILILDCMTETVITTNPISIRYRIIVQYFLPVIIDSSL